MRIIVAASRAVTLYGADNNSFEQGRCIGGAMSSRRDFLKTTGGLMLANGGAWRAGHTQAAVPPAPGFAALPSGATATGDLEALPGKLPLIKRSWRPPNYETPLSYFSEEFTPNKAFYVRYHLASIPEVAADKWILKIGGEAAATPFELNFEQLKRDFPAVEVAAVNQCSGARRGLFEPHVAGVEWGAGAMGNARWKGARLKDVLAKAGLKKEALEIVFDGADGPVMPATPDFQKSIPVWKAQDENTLVAYEMNGEPLPHWNGFPARVVVPGWTGTYWMKHIVSINAISKPFDNFWVKAAYRIPVGKFPLIDHFTSQVTEVNEPITEMVVNSLITNLAAGQQVAVGRPFEVKGMAWDGGRGIATVDVSADGGRSWRAATLGTDYGRFSFRGFSLLVTPTERGALTVMARATNRAGATQTTELIHNPAGYHHNVVQRIVVNAA
jgi:DMSO/TMAO reductase YedYZ molybdopterin-dependent catalytic subunit